MEKKGKERPQRRKLVRAQQASRVLHKVGTSLEGSPGPG